MATNISFNGSTYSIPAEGDSNWGTGLSNFFIAIPSGALQKSGGAFTLLAETDFGATYGLKAAYFKSRATNPSGTGIVRLGNAESIAWRNAGNTADLSLKVNASNLLEYAGSTLQYSLSVSDTAEIDLTLSSNVLSAAVVSIAYAKLVLTNSIVNADIASAAAIAYSKLALTGAILNADLAGSIVYSKLILTGSIVNADINASAAIAYSKLALSASIVNADVASGAAIAVNKLAAVTASKALVSDGSGFVSPSAVTATELGYVSGVTSAIQTQIAAQVPKSSFTAKGDILAGTGSSTFSALPLGSNGTFLSADSTQTSGVKWATVSSNVSVTSKTANYTIGSSDDLILGDATGGAFTLTLPTAVGATGKVYRIKKIDASINAVNIATTSAQTIDGLTSLVMGSRYDDIELISDNANWQVSVNNVSYVAHYYLSTATAVSAGNPIKFDTRIRDTQSAYSTSTGLFTAAVSGEYWIGFNGFMTSGSGVVVSAKLGNPYEDLATLELAGNARSGGHLIDLAAGQTLSLVSLSSVTFAGGTNNDRCMLSIYRVGN